MSEMEEKLNSVLGNPQMMQQIMSMAQSLGQSSSAQKETVTGEVQPPIDLALVQKLSGLAGQSAIDSDQRALLQALQQVPFCCYRSLEYSQLMIYLNHLILLLLCIFVNGLLCIFEMHMHHLR